MRDLSVKEVSAIAGGTAQEANNGYTFSFIISNSVFVGLAIGLLGGNIFRGAAIGGGYAALMMAANYVDSYAFETSTP